MPCQTVSKQELVPVRRIIQQIIFRKKHIIKDEDSFGRRFSLGGVLDEGVGGVG